MSAPENQAAWLKQANTPLEVGPAPMPIAGAGDIVVKNAAIAINPIDWHQQEVGIFVKQFPAIVGCDIAGEVHEVGSGVTRFNKGDRVIGHSTALITGRPADGAFALYTVVQADKAAILPSHIPFTEGVVLPFAIEAAVCGLSVKEPGPCMPGVTTPALGLPYPSTQTPAPSTGKVLIVSGASSSVGSMTTQIATAAGIKVLAISSAQNFDLAKKCGASQVFDRKDSLLVAKIVEAVKATELEFVGILDAISVPENYEQDLEILHCLGGGHLACTHPPPTEGVPSSVQTGMIFAVNDVVAPVFRDFVTPALQSGQLKCLPAPTVVGKGLQYVDEALKMSKAGVSATKLVVEL